jgi:hypothetical protein
MPKTHISRIALLVSGCLLVGCQLDAQGLLRELDDIERKRESGSFLQGLSALTGPAELGDRVREQTEDTVTEAYFRAGSDERREDVLDVVGYAVTGSGRFVPLLLYVMECEDAWALRASAAAAASRVERLTADVCGDGVAIAMAEVVEAAPTPHDREWAILYLENFLERGCNAPLPGEQVEDVMELPRATNRIRRRPPDVVWAWWQETGRALAERGELCPRDRPSE